jgi:hypothetical protein
MEEFEVCIDSLGAMYLENLFKNEIKKNEITFTYKHPNCIISIKNFKHNYLERFFEGGTNYAVITIIKNKYAK